MRPDRGETVPEGEALNRARLHAVRVITAHLHLNGCAEPYRNRCSHAVLAVGIVTELERAGLSIGRKYKRLAG